MTESDISTLERFHAARVAVSVLPKNVGEYRGLSSDETSAVAADLGEIIRAANASLALLADAVAQKSRRELGPSGLLQKADHRTLEGFLQHTIGITKQQAITAVRAGTLLGENADTGQVDRFTGEILEPSRPWLSPVAEAVTGGKISTVAAEVIGLGLGDPNSAVTPALLEMAALTLVAEAIAGVTPDRLRVRARELRNEIDLAGVKVREEEIHENRALVHFPLPQGGGKAILTMGIEDYAEFVQLADRATSPKLRGVRFVNEQQKRIAEQIDADPRTPRQLAFDAFMQLLRQGADADTSFMLGSGAPVIRITVAEEALATGVGLARIDGMPDPVSLETVERLACNGKTLRIGFDPLGNVLDLEKEQRLFSARQREVLAVKFGGCMDPNCDQPAIECEAHHILHWVKHRGKTVLENGILLCKYHHLKYHNEHWEIERDNFGNYWLIPPDTIDPTRTPRHMPLKSHNLNDLARYRTAS